MVRDPLDHCPTVIPSGHVTWYVWLSLHCGLAPLPGYAPGRLLPHNPSGPFCRPCQLVCNKSPLLLELANQLVSVLCHGSVGLLGLMGFGDTTEL